ncbi:MAG: SUF system Fe-S cluster assembly regulator [Sinobacteraceae bacterium]|nr:SUF system Fe-S cluster assembly regulator [Nevskia sp.]MDI3260973.1 SUF system Fe-S cluster assembly regulator [Nevskiaceae bacterium]
MFKLGKLTDYGTVVMATLAAEPQALRNAQALAAATHLSVPTVSKLLRQLARAGLLESARGAQGGYRLARAPARITVADVVAALEGPIALTQCAIHSGDCAIEPHCAVRANWRLIDTAIRQALEAVTLEHMAAALKSAHAHRRDVQPLSFVRSLPARH